MSSKNIYIGSGRATANEGVKVTLRMDQVQEHAYTTDKGTFITFMVAPRKEKDQFGKTHSAFIMPRESAQPSVVAEPAGVPEGELVEVDGRKLRRISKKKAAELRGEQA